ncbi:MAG: hypothetical protein LBK29_03935 [Oscillospiraceae bacterium]|jgi:hypothetical protein|nr:hypothetical protein [Oscillospiraceae bacterium]
MNFFKKVASSICASVCLLSFVSASKVSAYSTFDIIFGAKDIVITQNGGGGRGACLVIPLSRFKENIKNPLDSRVFETFVESLREEGVASTFSSFSLPGGKQGEVKFGVDLKNEFGYEFKRFNVCLNRQDALVFVLGLNRISVPEKITLQTEISRGMSTLEKLEYESYLDSVTEEF